MERPTKWRARSTKRSKGACWLLETGRNETRRSMTLGFVTDEQAQTARAAMDRQEELTIGTPMYGRVLRLYERDPEAALHVLLGGPDATHHFGPEPVDHGALLLRDYYETVYKDLRPCSGLSRCPCARDVHFSRVSVRDQLRRLRKRSFHLNVLSIAFEGMPPARIPPVDGSCDARGQARRQTAG